MEKIFFMNKNNKPFPNDKNKTTNFLKGIADYYQPYAVTFPAAKEQFLYYLNDTDNKLNKTKIDPDIYPGSPI